MSPIARCISLYLGNPSDSQVQVMSEFQSLKFLKGANPSNRFTIFRARTLPSWLNIGRLQKDPKSLQNSKIYSILSIAIDAKTCKNDAKSHSGHLSMSFTCTGSFDTQTSPAASYARGFEDLMWFLFSFNQTTDSDWFCLSFANSVRILSFSCRYAFTKIYKNAASQDPNSAFHFMAWIFSSGKALLGYVGFTWKRGTHDPFKGRTESKACGNLILGNQNLRGRPPTPPKRLAFRASDSYSTFMYIMYIQKMPGSTKKDQKGTPWRNPKANCRGDEEGDGNRHANNEPWVFTRSFQIFIRNDSWGLVKTCEN